MGFRLVFFLWPYFPILIFCSSRSCAGEEGEDASKQGRLPGTTCAQCASEGRFHGRTDRWTDRRTDGPTDGRTDRWTDTLSYPMAHLKNIEIDLSSLLSPLPVTPTSPNSLVFLLLFFLLLLFFYLLLFLSSPLTAGIKCPKIIFPPT